MINSNRVKRLVQLKYAQKVEESELWYPYCFSSHSALVSKDFMRIAGYSYTEIERCPQESIMGIGCGNPVSISHIQEGDTVLDLGCGRGTDLFLASHETGATGRMVGIDFTKEMIRKARVTAALHGYQNVVFHLGDIESLPYKLESFNVVVSNYAISFCPNLEKTFEEIYRVLKKDGYIIVSDVVMDGEPLFPGDDNDRSLMDCNLSLLTMERYLNTIENVGFKQVKLVTSHTFKPNDTWDYAATNTISITIQAYK